MGIMSSGSPLRGNRLLIDRYAAARFALVV